MEIFVENITHNGFGRIDRRVVWKRYFREIIQTNHGNFHYFNSDNDGLDGSKKEYRNSKTLVFC